MRNISRQSGFALRRLLVSLAIVLTLLVIIFTGLIMFADSERAQRWLVAEASDRLGRQITLGDFDIAWDINRYRQLKFEFSDLTVANPDDEKWAGSPALADAKSLLVVIDLWGLLRGDLVFARIAGDRPVVNLQKLASGDANWQFGTDSNEPSAEQPPQQPKKPLTLPRIETLNINGGRLTFNDVPAEIELLLN